MDLIERIAVLERAGLFAFVEAECLAQAALALEEEEASAGRRLYCVGEPADFLYLLCEGKVRLSLGGAELVVGPGECFGFEEVLSEGERAHSATAETPCRLLRLERGQARRLLEDDPGLARGAIRELLKRQAGGAPLHPSPAR